MESSIASGVRLRTINVCGLAPARAKTRAVSYSQFVPGNTGIRTRGCGVLEVAIGLMVVFLG